MVIHLYVTFRLPEAKEAWTFPNRDSVAGLGPYILVVLPSMLMLFLDWSAFEFHSLFASLISVESMGAQVIIINTSMAYFSLTVGLQCAAYTLVGREIGARNLAMAKRYRDIILYSSIILAFIQSLTVYVFRM